MSIDALPRPPRSFGSYPANDVTFLLTDLGDRIVESDLETREHRMRTGGHYSEMLPVEYEPSAEYEALFEVALERNASRVADCLAVAIERVLAVRSKPFVLVSLARAGTPVGILMRRYLLANHDLDVPHYSVSIIRDRGLDRVAIAWLRATHPDHELQFVDGWTGKGVIQRELERESALLGLDARLAVITDPGHCTTLTGSRDDFLIPSACLNATVSGLVSRTVLHPDLVGPGDFHGAKMYPDLADRDRSMHFIRTVTSYFTSDLRKRAAQLARDPISLPTWSGWTAIERIGARFDLDDANLIKPGIGEATRVLLRRKPSLLLVRRERHADLDHLLQLAAERGVPVVTFDDMPYSCCGLISSS